MPETVSVAHPTGSSAGLPPAARRALLAWYDARGRALAFRATRDPYAILVSEVMAQQTQISRVVPAWEAFLARFPTVETLAAASPADVIRAWRGMGYNRRALNLQRAAAAVVAEHGGHVPADVAALERVAGIGPYTARAVAAIAFGLPVAAVDTNVRRVLGRALAIPAGPAAAARFQAVADASLDRDRPGDWTHAVMDLGATVCRPRTPRCETCPIAPWCATASEAAAGATGVGARALDVTGLGAPATDATARRPRRASTPFEDTSRWLRGRILDRLRSADGGSWTRLAEPIGRHDRGAIVAALAGLERDGLVELHPSADGRARLAGA